MRNICIMCYLTCGPGSLKNYSNTGMRMVKTKIGDFGRKSATFHSFWVKMGLILTKLSLASRPSPRFFDKISSLPCSTYNRRNLNMITSQYNFCVIICYRKWYHNLSFHCLCGENKSLDKIPFPKDVVP